MTDKTMTLQEKLRHLFQLDQQVRGLRSRTASATRRLAAKSKKLLQFQTQQQELQTQIMDAQAKSNTLEHEAQDVQQRIERLREQMNSVTNNKEYSAVLVEVNTLKLEKEKLEEQTLEQMTRLEEMKVRLEEIQGRIDEQNLLVERERKEVLASEQAVGDRLEMLDVQRQEAANAIPPEVLKTFERLVDAHDGEALSPIIEDDRRRKEYHCGGCFLSIPVERLNSLMIGGDDVVCCPSCGRMLYLEQELNEALTKK